MRIERRINHLFLDVSFWPHDENSDGCWIIPEPWSLSRWALCLVFEPAPRCAYYHNATEWLGMRYGDISSNGFVAEYCFGVSRVFCGSLWILRPLFSLFLRNCVGILKGFRWVCGLLWEGWRFHNPHPKAQAQGGLYYLLFCCCKKPGN